VIASRARELKPGDAVTSRFGWREYFIAALHAYPVGTATYYW